MIDQLKLTDPDYVLHIIEALSQSGIIEGGTTKPLKFSGINRETLSRDHQYILKWNNANRMSGESCAKELLGAWIAKELDIECVEPVLAHISEQFAEKVMNGREGQKAAFQSIGINFASVYIDGLASFTNQMDVKKKELLDQAMSIFVFDLFVDNADRGQGRPNLFYKNGRLIVLDHELIFGFTDLIMPLNKTTPWMVYNDIELYKKHPLLPFLKGVEYNLAPVMDRLLHINDHFWKCAFSLMPNDWLTEKIKNVRFRLTQIAEHKEEFEEQIQKILSS